MTTSAHPTKNRPTMNDLHSQGLRRWARGSYPLEAAVELLTRAFGGKFAEPGNPWLPAGDRPWLDVRAMTDDELGVLAGGEQRVLRIVRSLAGGPPANLNDDVPGLDRAVLALVLAAIAHAGGSHEHGPDPEFDADGNFVGFGQSPGSLYPWPR